MSQPVEPPDKPGLDILLRHLRPIEQEEMDRDREAYLAAMRDRHLGQTVVCLGTGPTLGSLDLDALRRFPTLGCNGIGHVFQPDYYVIADPFIYGLHEEVFLACPGLRILSSFTHGRFDLRLYYRREDLIGLSRDRIYSADNTGYLLLSTACVMGARRVILAGYDGYPPWAARHHAYEELEVERERVAWEWRPGTDKEALMREGYTFAAREAPKLGLEIRLLTPSHLLGDLFPRIELDELLAGP